MWSLWGLPKIRGPILGAPIIRIVLDLGPFWAPLCLETPIYLLGMYSNMAFGPNFMVWVVCPLR